MAKRSLRRFRTWCLDRHGFGQCLGAVEVEARENPSWLAAMTTIAHAASGSRIYVSSCDLGTRLCQTRCNRAGSIRFILHQAQEPGLIDSEMKNTVSHAVDLVFRVSSPDEETFETLAEGIDGRVLGSLRSFFKVLDDAGATMRMVDDPREFTLQRQEVTLARERAESIAFDETEREVTGTIYILPVSRRFELHPVDGGEALRGAISPDCLDHLTAGGTEVRPELIGTVHTARLRIRDIRARGHEPRKGYTPLSIDDPRDLRHGRTVTRG